MLKRHISFAEKFLLLILFLSIFLGYSLLTKKKVTTYLSSNTNVQYAIKSLPPISLKNAFDQSEIIASSFITKKFIHLWATWCAPCIEELPLLIQFAKKKNQYNFFLIAIKDDNKKIKKLFKTLKLERPSNVFILEDPTGVMMDKLGTSRLPETFLFNSTNLIENKWVGSQNWSLF